MSLHKALRRAAPLAIVVLLASCSSTPGAGTGSGRSPAATPASGESSPCKADRIATPAWFPHALPLPKRTFASHALPTTARFHRAVLIVPLPTSAFKRFVLAKWPAAGYVLGRIAAGNTHFAGSFVKEPDRGTFLAEARCGGKSSLLYLGYAAGGPSPSSS